MKKSRRTPNGGLRSGRWKVKSFKADVKGQAVTLMAVSSPFSAHDHQGRLRVKTLNVTSESAMVVLGVSNASEILRLMREFERISEIRMPRPGRLAELPVWTWDYPAFHYERRNARLANIAKILQRNNRSPLALRKISSLPPVLLVFLGVELPIDLEKHLDPQQREFLETLHRCWQAPTSRRREKASVPRLAWLYLFILHAWLRYRLAGHPSDATRILELFGSLLIFSNSTSKTAGSALGIVDPAATLDQLLKSLALLDRHLPPQLFVEMSRFTLLYNGVLSADFPDGKRRTLLAHCGGRLPNLVECGNWPLVYGKVQSCACGRLICDICQSCTSVTGAACEHELRRKGRPSHTDDIPNLPR